MIDFANPIIIWSFIGIILLFVEFFAPGFVIFFFGLGGLAVSLACYLYPNLSINYQLILFIISSLIMLVILRRWFKKIFSGFFSKKDEMPKNIDSNIGETAIVTEKITPNSKGKIEFHGTNWSAISDVEIPKGATVVITKQNNLTFEVKELS